jgi:hypothetical protein
MSTYTITSIFYEPTRGEVDSYLGLLVLSMILYIILLLVTICVAVQVKSLHEKAHYNLFNLNEKEV